MKPLKKALELAQPRLMALDGFAFEKLVRKLHQECSRKGKGDFELSDMQLGYWNRPRDASRSVEIDVVALDEANKRVRFGSCKRAARAHTSDSIAEFERHVEVFLAARDHRHLQGWEKQLCVFSPDFTEGDRSHFESKGYIARDLNDYAALF